MAIIAGVNVSATASVTTSPIAIGGPEVVNIPLRAMSIAVADAAMVSADAVSTSPTLSPANPTADRDGSPFRLPS